MGPKLVEQMCHFALIFILVLVDSCPRSDPCLTMLHIEPMHPIDFVKALLY
jgi:hypothetical protein